MKKFNSILFLIIFLIVTICTTRYSIASTEKIYEVKNGWMKIDGKWYFTNADGTLKKNQWLFRNNVYYFFGEDGARIENGWYQHKANKKWSYFKRGVAQKNVEIKFGSYYKYIGEDRYAVKDTWVKHKEHKWSYYGKGEYRIENGKYQIKYNQKWSYFRNGYALENEWVTDKKTKKTYFVDDNNYIRTGQWIENKNGSWSYVREDGSRVENGLFKIPHNNKWAYFKNGTALKNEWVEMNGYYHYFGSDNYMIYNTFINGRFLDKNGRWYPPTKVSLKNGALSFNDLKNDENKKINKFIEDVKIEYKKLYDSYRRSSGISPLRLNEEFRKGCKIRTDEMLLTGHYSHTRPNGKSHETAFDYLKGKYLMGENIFCGNENYLINKTPREFAEFILQTFKDSKGHDENLKYIKYTDYYMEISIEKDKEFYVSMNFGIYKK